MAARCAAGWAQKTRPESYGTLSHLCASVAQESARSAPATSGRSRGLAAAHSPNAPSTCTQAPCGRAASQISPTGSSAPLLTLPSCAHTIAGPALAVELRPQRRRPHPALVVRVHLDDRHRCRAPRKRSARSIVPCRSRPASTRTRGAPHRPSALDVPAGAPEHRPARPIASPVTLAICAPVTKPADTPAGRPSSSASQPPATSSATAAAGPST